MPVNMLQTYVTTLPTCPVMEPKETIDTEWKYNDKAAEWKTVKFRSYATEQTDSKEMKH